VRGKPRFGCPVANVGKFIAIGLNYADHAAESGLPIPKEPVVFMKATSCIQGPNDPVMLPQGLGQERLGSGARRGHRHARALRVA
jgi:2,4-diketo-3-deoxy-L-fuconate hydrolase